VRFALIDVAKEEFPVHRLCRVLGVSQSGYFAWKSRPACRRQQENMVLLAHVWWAFALSHGTLWQPADNARVAGQWLGCGTLPDRPPDAGEWPSGSAEAAVQADRRQQP
jgi:putative transposase